MIIAFRIHTENPSQAVLIRVGISKPVGRMSGLLSKRDFLRAVRRMDPYEFEEFLSDVLESRGYETVVRSGSGDRGIDIIASKNGNRELYQAKRYAESNKVGSEEVRKYATLYQQDSEADLVVIVTTSSFTTEGRKLAADLHVETIDGADLFEMVNAHAPRVALDYLDQSEPTAQQGGETTATEWEIEKESPFQSPSLFSEIKDNQVLEYVCPECGEAALWKGKKREGIIYTVLKCANCESTWAYEDPWPEQGPTDDDDWEQIPHESALERKEPNKEIDPCFIATAAYGTPKAQEIDYLRDFRDEVLLQSNAGELFVELYYEHSPPIADWIAQREWRRRAVRTLIIDPALRLVRPFV